MNPVYTKLGIKENYRISTSVESHVVDTILKEVPFQFERTNIAAFNQDLILFFCNSKSVLEDQLELLIPKIKKNGIIWIAWFKKSSGKQKDLNENGIREIALKTILVDVKVCSINTDWSALKLVIRKSLR